MQANHNGPEDEIDEHPDIEMEDEPDDEYHDVEPPTPENPQNEPLPPPDTIAADPALAAERAAEAAKGLTDVYVEEAFADGTPADQPPTVSRRLWVEEAKLRERQAEYIQRLTASFDAKFKAAMAANVEQAEMIGHLRATAKELQNKVYALSNGLASPEVSAKIDAKVPEEL